MASLEPMFQAPYYAVIFSSVRTPGDNGYGQMAARMVELASLQPGFLGIDSAREEIGITVSYWRDLESIRRWRADLEHREAQRHGKETWYNSYTVRVAKVEREYSFG
ncbi:MULTISPECIES: antibiotic biosynthesis monooxygenase family protein [unclassified Marinobacter]|jgi:heme-degrading monooxygenase HmoA|uniref:antibiotic biosynthesis monooxygenase family protein n=1 Tax=unclassified Marinobacter TaxID=83889 RepID=UPI0019262EBF|nr:MULTISPECIES: antibiotic biosynthesis monooxygenase [unclassified Marinobacter]MBL3827202.1 antibiotic biosynthesis monooxygenase [Marinobacter sp. MC3]MBL3895708.1 antibiotic biosynthesis monooxygenase [Marinobacter sp. MW3]